MNRGFFEYFSKGLRTSASLLLKGGKYVRYYLYYFMSLLGRCIPVVGSVFWVADVRRAKIALREKELTVLRPLESVDTGRSFGTAVLSFWWQSLVFLGGLIAIGLLGALLFLCGRWIAWNLELQTLWVLPVVFLLPAIIAAAGYMLSMFLLFAPTAYLIDSGSKAGASCILAASVETMRRAGKGTYFLNVLVPQLCKAAYGGIAGLVFYLLSGLGSAASNAVASAVAGTVWAIVAIGLYIVFAPVLDLASSIANVQLFDDIAIDAETMNDRVKGLFVKRCAVGNALADKGRDESLESLFAKTPTERTDPPDTRYVPPTDWADKMKTFTDDDESGATDENGAQQSAQSNDTEGEQA